MTTDIRPVKIGAATLTKPMTQAQALRYGARNMPADLKRANFQTVIFVSDLNINGALFYRINYAK